MSVPLRSSTCSSAQSNQAVISKDDVKSNETSDRLRQLQSQSAFLVNDNFFERKNKEIV